MSNELIRNIIKPPVNKLAEVSKPVTPWETRRIGIKILEDSQQQKLEAIGDQLNDISNKLENISKTAESIINPVIQTMRSAENPFSELFKQLADQADEFLQIIENAGTFYMLDKFSEVVTYSSNNSKLISSDYLRSVLKNADLREYIKKYNLARQKLRNETVIGEPVNSVKTAEELTYLTQQEIITLAEYTDLINNAIMYLEMYESDEIELFDKIAELYKNKYTAISALSKNLPENVRNYYGSNPAFVNQTVVKPSSENENENDGSRQNDEERKSLESKVYFNVPKMSYVLRNGGIDSYIAGSEFRGMVQEGNVVVFDTELSESDRTIDYTHSNFSFTVSVKDIERELKSSSSLNKFDFVDSLLSGKKDAADGGKIVKATAIFGDFLQQFKKILDKYSVNIGNESDKKREIYELIENVIRKKDKEDGDNKNVTVNKTMFRVNGQVVSSYRESAEKFMRDFITDDSVMFKDINLSLQERQKLKKDLIDSDRIISRTTYGYANDVNMIDELLSSINSSHTKEKMFLARLQDMINLQIETNGLAQPELSLPKSINLSQSYNEPFVNTNDPYYVSNSSNVKKSETLKQVEAYRDVIANELLQLSVNETISESAMKDLKRMVVENLYIVGESLQNISDCIVQIENSSRNILDNNVVLNATDLNRTTVIMPVHDGRSQLQLTGDVSFLLQEITRLKSSFGILEDLKKQNDDIVISADDPDSIRRSAENLKTAKSIIFQAIFDEDYSPFKLTASYVEKLNSVLYPSSSIWDSVSDFFSSSISKPTIDIFYLYKTGSFENESENEKRSALLGLHSDVNAEGENNDPEQVNSDAAISERVSLLNYFANLSYVFSESDVDLPVVYYDTVNGSGYRNIVFNIIKKCDDLITSLKENSEIIRSDVINELATINAKIECGTPEDVVISDERKNKISKKRISLNQELNELEALLIREKDDYRSKYNEAINITDVNLLEQKVVALNSRLDNIGGFKISIANGKMVVTDEYINGTLTDRIAKLKAKIESLNIESFNLDNELQLATSDGSLKNVIYDILSVVDQETVAGAARSLDEEAYEKIKLISTGSFTDTQYQTLLNASNELFDVINDIRKLKSVKRRIESIYENGDFPFAAMALKIFSGNALAGSVNVGENVVEYDVHSIYSKYRESAGYNAIIAAYKLKSPDDIHSRDDFSIKDSDSIIDFMAYNKSRAIDSICALIQDYYFEYQFAGPLVSAVRSELNSSPIIDGVGTEIILNADIDYSKYINYFNYKVNAPYQNEDGSVVLNKFNAVPLSLVERLEQLNVARSLIQKKLIAYSTEQKIKDQTSILMEPNTIFKLFSKNEWITSVMRDFSDPTDPFRPVFIGDINRSKPFDAIFGSKTQREIEKMKSYGTMTVVPMIIATTDFEDLYNSGRYLYSIFTNSENSEVRQKVNQIRGKFEKLFATVFDSDLDGTSDGILDWLDEFATGGTEDLFASASRFASDLFKTRGDCEDLPLPMITKNNVNIAGRWTSAGIRDLPYVNDIFERMKYLIDKLRFSFTPQLSAADFFEELLKFFKKKIEMLQNLSAALGLLIELINFMVNMQFAVSQLAIRGVTRLSEVENALRNAGNFPYPPTVVTDDERMIIAGFIFVMPDYVYDASFSKIFKDSPKPSINIPVSVNGENNVTVTPAETFEQKMIDAGYSGFYDACVISAVNNGIDPSVASGQCKILFNNISGDISNGMTYVEAISNNAVSGIIDLISITPKNNVLIVE